MPLRSDIPDECAVLATAEGVRVHRPDAVRRSLERFLAAAAALPEAGHQELVWSEDRGWHRRALLPPLETRADEENGAGKLRGYAIVFDVKSEDLGGFREIIRAEAVERSLREDVDLRALVDHDSGRIIGRKTAGTLRATADRKGLRVEIDAPDTTVGRDIVESVRRRDVTGMSFAFRTLTDDWHMEGGTPIREVTDMTVLEVSAVSFPAYPQTIIEAPSEPRRSSPRLYAARLKQMRAEVS